MSQTKHMGWMQPMELYHLAHKAAPESGNLVEGQPAAVLTAVAPSHGSQQLSLILLCNFLPLGNPMGWISNAELCHLTPRAGNLVAEQAVAVLVTKVCLTTKFLNILIRAGSTVAKPCNLACSAAHGPQPSFVLWIQPAGLPRSQKSTGGTSNHK